MAQNISTKVVRLLSEGRVRPAVAPVEEFHVDGDTPGSRYHVFIGAHTAFCTCPASGVCSHLAAARTWASASAEEKALMVEALQRAMEPSERWLPIVGYEGRYEVSSYGRVRALFPSNRGPVGRIVGTGGDGRYLQVSLYRADGSRRSVRVHVLVLTTFVGLRPDGLVTRHLDGNPTNNVLANLAWATQARNLADTIQHGTASRGERHGRARLREGDVHEIRSRVAHGESRVAIARRFCVSRQTVGDIVTGRRWAWLTVERAETANAGQGA